ncbi:MAG: shikimate kinase [Spirochaeta sp.]
MDSVDDFAQSLRLQTTIILLGMKHVGKTTLGQQFASRHQLSWIDMDEVIVDMARGSYHIEARSARDVYLTQGKEGFQEIETAAAKYLRVYCSRNQIIATGGGIADNPGAMLELTNTGIQIYLREHEDILFPRIMARGLPPFLDPKDPRASFAELYRSRDAVYRAAADICVELNGAGITEALSMLEESVRGTLLC